MRPSKVENNDTRKEGAGEGGGGGGAGGVVSLAEIFTEGTASTSLFYSNLYVEF